MIYSESFFERERIEFLFIKEFGFRIKFLEY